MKINIELNTKELDILLNDKGTQSLEYLFTIDLYTEARKELTTKEETVIYAGLFWALITMLPSSLIHHLFKQWNTLVKELSEGLSKGNSVSIKSDN